MVTRDRRELLEQALDALAAQTLPADEVLVVENGSRTAPRPRSPRGPAPAACASRPARRAARWPRPATRRPPPRRCGDRLHRRRLPPGADLAGGARRRHARGGRHGAGAHPPRPAQPVGPLSRSQETPAEFGLYETCNVAYDPARWMPPGRPRAGPFDLASPARSPACWARWFARYPFGEDTELAWRCKRAGARSRRVHAVVDHHVFPPDSRLLLRRAWIAAGFPAGSLRIPEFGGRGALAWRAAQPAPRTRARRGAGSRYRGRSGTPSPAHGRRALSLEDPEAAGRGRPARSAAGGRPCRRQGRGRNRSARLWELARPPGRALSTANRPRRLVHSAEDRLPVDRYQRGARCELSTFVPAAGAGCINGGVAGELHAR